MLAVAESEGLGAGIGIGREDLGSELGLEITGAMCGGACEERPDDELAGVGDTTVLYRAAFCLVVVAEIVGLDCCAVEVFEAGVLVEDVGFGARSLRGFEVDGLLLDDGGASLGER